MVKRSRADKSLERSRESVENRLLHSFERSKERHNLKMMRRRREEWELLGKKPRMLEESKRLLRRREVRTPVAAGKKPSLCRGNGNAQKEGVLDVRNRTGVSLRASTPLNGSISYNKGLRSSPSYKRIPPIQFVESTEDFEIRNRCTFTPKLNKNSMALNSRRNSKKLEATKQSGKVAELHKSLSLIHICRCRRYAVCRSRWSPYH
eukprot:TRINITY_DN14029_c0_g1_i4.p2 TRINITY_DN14029_c0_g1~~TRINITY_DN14029_c0_g1_i4.p2  ORF type:complete len:206 (+),score=44.18 TRINITY_DN14029_c0_g1_i4:459-1076(+)